MNNRTHSLLGLLTLLSIINFQPSSASAQNTVFSYEGRVTDKGTNFNGAGQFEFALVTSSNANSTATATATLSGKFVVSYNVTFSGTGYVTAPAVTVFGGGGSGAAAHATISGGMVTSLVADNAGSGYTSPPTVTIAPPPPNISYTTWWSNDGTSVNGSEPSLGVNVPVNDGLFTVILGDTSTPNMEAIPASLFNQQNLQLRIWFNDGVNGYAALSPVQSLTPTPYAIFANTAGNLNAASISSGTLADTRLSSDVALRNATQTFTGQNTFNNAGGVTISGPVSASTIAPASTLTIAGDILMAGGATTYHNFSLTGGNSTGFLYGSYPAFGDGIHLGYNYYADNNGTSHIINSGGGTSRISVGYGYVGLATAGADSYPTQDQLFMDQNGNVGIGTTSPAYKLDVNGDARLSGLLVNGPASAQAWDANYMGVVYDINIGRTAYAQSFVTTTSDIEPNVKTNLTSVTADEMLVKVASLPISSWNFKADLKSRHIGPMTQDFHSAFNLGADDKHINLADEGGVALAAIQGLNQKLNERDAEIAGLKERLAKLEQLVNSKNQGGK